MGKGKTYVVSRFMKRIMGLFFWAVVALSASGNDTADYRMFTSKDGREIEARIVGFDSKKGKLQIERKGKGKVWVAPNVFSDQDQNYIKEWVAASAFLSHSNLRISLEKKKGTESKRSTGESPFVAESKFQKVYFEINIRNMSPNSIAELCVEYCYYVKIKGEVLGRDIDKMRLETGEIKIGTLAAAEGKTLRTDNLLLETKYKKSMMTIIQ